MKTFLSALLLSGLFSFSLPATAQYTSSTKLQASFSLQMQRLDSLASLPDAVNRKKQIDLFWTELMANKQIPFTEGDSVAFLYKGPADSVSWQGDFNGWGSRAGGHIFNNRGYRVGKSDVWRMVAAFPQDARIDYKIVLNGREWITDPANPHQQWGGGGPNSELRMPAWQPEEAAADKKNIARGKLSDNLSVKSNEMGYALQYKVYLPAGYEKLSKLPVVYVTDGHEYADDRMGAMVRIMDNLIAEHKIKPVIAVFIDPREIANPDNNRRMIELVLNDKFVSFITQELVPAIDKKYKTDPSPQSRGIMGTSLGGLNAAYVGIKASDKISLLGIHSPAFWYRPQIYTLYENSPKLPLKIFMSTGVISDTEEGARRMKSILESKQYTLQYKEVNEGHSWGNWRALIDDILLYFFPA